MGEEERLRHVFFTTGFLSKRKAAGRTISVHKSVKAMAMERSSPMEAVPRCGDSMRLPKEATVVAAVAAAEGDF